jgi:predicted enzyme related to lactoylglutathione lyase
VTARFDLVTLDAEDLHTVSRFWRAALDLIETEVEHDHHGARWIVLSDRSAQRRIGLQRGRTVPGTVHLDLACTPAQFERELQRLLSLGASMVSSTRVEPYGSIVNLADPAGYTFDLCAYA